MLFLEWNILIHFSLKFLSKGPIDHIPALVQVMDQHQTLFDENDEKLYVAIWGHQATMILTVRTVTELHQ